MEPSNIEFIKVQLLCAVAMDFMRLDLHASSQLVVPSFMGMNEVSDWKYEWMYKRAEKKLMIIRPFCNFMVFAQHI